MIQSTEWVLNAILHRYPASRREALSLFLSQSQRDRLQTMPEPKIEAQAEEPSLLDYLHWSWLVPFFKPKTGKEQKLFLSALPQGLREKLSIALAIKLSGKESLKTIGKDFLLQQIREFFLGETNEKLPLYFLPPSPLTPLLRMKKQDIIRLIDYIALYDLATEIQRIVDTKILKKIYAFLIK